jgi:predicted aspartyl protease
MARPTGPRRSHGLLVLALAVACTTAYGGECKLEQLSELPVTLRGTRPLVHAGINGVDALFLADSGAFYSSVTPATAAAYKLPLQNAPVNFGVTGVEGDAHVMLTVVRTFTFFGLAIPNVNFLVLEGGGDSGSAGLLGQNVFRFGDVEYDLANRIIRLMRAKDCKNTALAYWAGAQSKPFSVVEIETPTREEPHTIGVASVNGKPIRVMFDTGAARSLLSIDAARRAGVTPDSPGVVAAGMLHGVGRGARPSWIAPFASFKIGDEEIRNTHLRIGEERLQVDMLLGADFFLSHRIYVASGQRKLYFTYNGGPVFDLTVEPPASPAPEPPAGH